MAFGGLFRRMFPQLEMMRYREGSLFSYTSGIGDSGFRWTLQANDPGAGDDALLGRQSVQLYQWYRRLWTSVDASCERRRDWR